MEIKITSQQILKFLQILAWIIFVGVSIEAAVFICNALATWLLDPQDAQRIWQQVDLSNLYQFDRGFFFVQMLLISIVALLKAILFYLIIKLLQDNKLSMTQPFNNAVGRFLFLMAYLTFSLALFSSWGVNYYEWFVSKGIAMPNIQDMRLGGADVWLFMSVTLFIIAHIFKRGIEMQTENELTV